MRILYAATGEIAVPLLEALYKEGLVSAVLTAPDAPGKRGKGLIPTPVKVKAMELGIEVYQPETIRSEARKRIREAGADTLLSFCYGRIFGPMFLSMFSECYNVHPSLLPRHRGCSPIFEAIRQGDRESGITLQKIALKVDEGDIIAQHSFPLDGTETEESLSRMVAGLVPSVVVPALLSQRIPRPQEGEATYTGFVSKDDGRIDFSLPASAIHAQIRACYPWPKAYAMLSGEKISITGVHGSAFDSFEPCTEAPGTIAALDRKKGLKVATGSGYIYISRILPPMKKEMDAVSFCNGRKNVIGSVLEG